MLICVSEQSLAKLNSLLTAAKETEYKLRCYVLPNTGCDEAHEAHRILRKALDEFGEWQKQSTDTR